MYGTVVAAEAETHVRREPAAYAKIVNSCDMTAFGTGILHIRNINAGAGLKEPAVTPCIIVVSDTRGFRYGNLLADNDRLLGVGHICRHKHPATCSNSQKNVLFHNFKLFC